MATTFLPPMQRIAAIAALAAGYYVLGYLAKSTILPTDAAPVWPAAGWALAGLLYLGVRAWPAIAVAAFFLNIPPGVINTGALTPAATLSLGIAAGATLQALAGAVMVRSFLAPPDETGRLQRFGAVLALGGPVACLVSATVAAIVLYAMGAMSRAEVISNWFTWWVGDTIGSLIGLSLYLIWTLDRQWVSRRSRVVATMLMMVLLGVLTLLFARTSALDREHVESQFTQRGALIAHSLEQKLAEYAEAVGSLANFLTVTAAPLDRDTFRKLTGETLARHPNLHALTWSPVLPQAQRAEYERGLRANGFGGIREISPDRALVPAGVRPGYVPLTFIEPLAANRGAVGFDLGSEAVRHAALQQARDSGAATASALLQLPYVEGAPGAVLITAAAYRPDAPRGTVAERRAAVRGYVSAVLQVDKVMHEFLRGIDPAGLRVRLTDLGAAPSGQVLFESAPAELAPGAVLQLAPARPDLVQRTTFEVGGRQWELALARDSSSPLPYRAPMSWGVRIAGVLFAGLFSSLLLMMVGRTATIERRVRQRTAELGDSIAALREANEGLERSQQALRQSEDQARSVLETARDAYIAFDLNGRVVDWNREAEATLGWTRAEAVGRDVAGLLLPARSGRPRQQRLMRKLTSGSPNVLNRRIETVAQHRHGYRLPVEIMLWATGNDQQQRFHVFLHDISSRLQDYRRLEAQEAAAAALVESASLTDAAPKVLQAICNALDWCVGAVWMIADDQTMRCCAFWSRDPRTADFEAACRRHRFRRGEGLPGRVWLSGRPEWIRDIAADGQLLRQGEAIGAGLHSAFAFPLTAGNEMLGVIECFSQRIEESDPGLLQMMETVGRLLGQFVARRRAESALYEEKERAQVTLGSIADGVIVTDTHVRVSYMNPVAEVLTGWSAAEAHGRPVNEVFQLVAQSDGVPVPNPLETAVRANRLVSLGSEVDLVRRDGQRLTVEDSSAPVHDRAGQVVGGVMVFHDVSEARALQMKMSHLTRHDHLTSLPNRALLQERLAQMIGQARSRHGKLALLYIDLDGFKHINDSLGHDVGDQLLREVTSRLLQCVRPGDTVSRQGGDEFTVLLPEIRSSSDAIRIAENILQAVRQPFPHGDAELNLSASVGIALYPSDGDDAGVLLKHADAAMYLAKQSGRNQYRFYTREISERADRRLAIESALHQALRNNELVLHYQPKIIPSTGAISGTEALVRWQRPDGQLVMPGEFIEIAEDSGLISRIDHWVLEQACRQNRAWQDAGLPSVPVSVNLSGANAQIEEFPALLADVLQRTGLDPVCLQIELTESQMLHDTERFETLIRGINAQGVKVAIDDFGTGYASLGYLHRFPFDVLKIDQSFVRALTQSSTESAIVDAITRLARAFGYVVVAEGVETPEQADILARYGCDEMQGYLYSRPLPPEEIEALLRANAAMP